ncbi:HAD family hydrolase [Streptomyces fuscichromogenes]|uniref:HAD family hydrolase n=1 Tax=Streptomyces fuscichromogenes TaxID=1324013 RepID=UPI003815610F
MRKAVPRTCLIVDFGGVLTTSLDDAVRGFEAREGLPEGAVERSWYRDPAMVELTHDLERGWSTQFDWNQCMGEALGIDSTDLLGRVFADSHLDESMVSVLARARASGRRTGLLSNSMGLAPWNMYRGLDIDTTFDAAFISEQHGLRKPDPAVYELILKILEVPGDQCVFVDDNAENLLPAEALGMATVLHRGAEQTTTRLEELLGVALRAGFVNGQAPLDRPAAHPTRFRLGS